jgi:uridine kinase
LGNATTRIQTFRGILLIESGRKKADIPVYSFEKHARLNKTTTIYSPHVLILEGIFALHDQRVLDMLDLRIYTEAESDLCLSRRRTFSAAVLYFPIAKSNCKPVIRDVRERGRDIEGCIKQWFGFVKPNFVRDDVSYISMHLLTEVIQHKFVEPQRNVAGRSTSVKIDQTP